MSARRAVVATTREVRNNVYTSIYSEGSDINYTPTFIPKM